MSDATMDLDLQEQIAQIKRSQEETRKFVAEQHKLMAEARKLERDNWFAPWLVLIGAVSSVAAFIAALIAALKATGVI